MKPEVVGISRVFKDDDPALYRETIIHCIEVKDGKYKRKSIMVTEAEKWLLESIAMRLFIDRKKYIDISKTRLGDGTIEVKGLLTVERF